MSSGDAFRSFLKKRQCSAAQIDMIVAGRAHLPGLFKNCTPRDPPITIADVLDTVILPQTPFGSATAPSVSSGVTLPPQPPQPFAHDQPSAAATMAAVQEVTNGARPPEAAMLNLSPAMVDNALKSALGVAVTDLFGTPTQAAAVAQAAVAPLAPPTTWTRWLPIASAVGVGAVALYLALRK